MSKEEIDEKNFKNLEAEIDLLKKLDHLNIVKYVGLVESDNHINLILEYIESGSLYHIIKQIGVMIEPLAAGYTAQILKGMEYLHRQFVIHRDIKASNILITGDGCIKLADFGIATTSTSATIDDPMIEGSPFWLAPEVIKLQKPTYACDIWSLGCTIIELLTGYPPYFDIPAMSALFKIVQDEKGPPISDKFSHNLREFLKKCFFKEPEDRSRADELLNEPWIKENQTPGIPVKITLEDAKNTLRDVHGKSKVAVKDIDWNGSPGSDRSDKSDGKVQKRMHRSNNSITLSEDASDTSSHDDGVSKEDLEDYHRAGLERNYSPFFPPPLIFHSLTV